MTTGVNFFVDIKNEARMLHLVKDAAYLFRSRPIALAQSG